MKFGFVASTGSPVEAVTLAQAAEHAGWDGIFTWDGISFGPGEAPSPFALLGALAQATSTITLGAMVFALSRRKPWEVAREALTIDRLSGGRLVLPVGLGAIEDAAFSNVNTDTTDIRERAARLDEVLAFLRASWTGERFSHEGAHFQARDFQIGPPPVAGSIPIWAVGKWPAPKSLRRAAACDGIIVQADPLDAATVRDVAAWAAEAARPGFEIVVEGRSEPGPAGERLTSLAHAGATWFIESRWDGDTFDSLLTRVQAGPPRL